MLQQTLALAGPVGLRSGNQSILTVDGVESAKVKHTNMFGRQKIKSRSWVSKHAGLGAVQVASADALKLDPGQFPQKNAIIAIRTSALLFVERDPWCTSGQMINRLRTTVDKIRIRKANRFKTLAQLASQQWSSPARGV